MNSIVPPESFVPPPGVAGLDPKAPPSRRPCAARTPPHQEDGASEANVWLRQLFAAKSAQTGGVVRRRLRDIETIVGLSAFEDEVERLGYTAITDGRQVVVFCHAGGVRRLA